MISVVINYSDPVFDRARRSTQHLLQRPARRHPLFGDDEVYINHRSPLFTETKHSKPGHNIAETCEGIVQGEHQYSSGKLEFMFDDLNSSYLVIVVYS